MRVVVTLTTVPPRFRYLPRTLDSIRAQSRKPDRIVLNVPGDYLRFGPCRLEDLAAAAGSGVEINLVPRDFGPATKLVGATFKDDLQPDDLLISIDDDRHYDAKLISRHLEANLADANSVKTEAGWEIEELSSFGYRKTLSPRGVEFERDGYIDCLGGCCGVSLFKRHLDEDAREVPREALFVDDIFFSAYFAKKGVPIRVLKDGIDQLRTYAEVVAPLYWGKEQERRRKLNQEAIGYFRDCWGVWRDPA
jgi:hypothetical protein